MNIELDDYSQTEAFEETELQESSKIETFEVTLDLDGERLDKVLASSLKDISRSRLKTLIEDGLVKVNGKTVDKPKEKMSFGDEFPLKLSLALKIWISLLRRWTSTWFTKMTTSWSSINPQDWLYIRPPGTGTTRF